MYSQYVSSSNEGNDLRNELVRATSNTPTGLGPQRITIRFISFTITILAPEEDLTYMKK